MSKLSKSEFEAIVDAVAAERSWNIASAVVTGFTVDLMVISARRKEHWRATCYFDQQSGKCTGVRAVYRNANEPHLFANEVERRIADRMP